MKALVCDFCGGGLIIDDSREFAICEFCRTKYMASTLRQKIQEIRGTVSVEGEVSVKQADFVIRAGVLEKYNGSEVDVVIPNSEDDGKSTNEVILNNEGNATEEVFDPSQTQDASVGGVQQGEQIEFFDGSGNNEYYDPNIINGVSDGSEATLVIENPEGDQDNGGSTEQMEILDM